jgi:hypothetical protein
MQGVERLEEHKALIMACFDDAFFGQKDERSPDRRSRDAEHVAQLLLTQVMASLKSRIACKIQDLVREQKAARA